MAEAEHRGAEKKGRTKARAKARGVAETNPSEMVARTEDAAAGEDDLAETAKASSVMDSAEAIAAACSRAAETQENVRAKAEEQSGTEVKKVDLTENDNVRELAAEQPVPDVTLATPFLETWHAIAAETSNYSRRSFESHYSFLEKLLGAAACGSICQIAAEHAKTSYAALIAYLTKMTALRAKLSNEFFKPIETAFTAFRPGDK
jgi:Phasin protein